jgi:HPr kinase/phosphorylase
MADQNTYISVSDLFEKFGEQLAMQWVGGRNGGGRIITPEEYRPTTYDAVEDDLDDLVSDSYRKSIVCSGKSLAGYLNLIHPHQIQILGGVELDYLGELRDITRHDTVKQLIAHGPACIVIAEDREPPGYLTLRCNEQDIPLFISSLTSMQLMESLRYYLTKLFADTIILHGVFMEVMTIGVLLTGPSGIGKSELALELIARGHSRLVADDAPTFSRIAPDVVCGDCPVLLRDFLEVRGLGIINIRRLYGDNSIKSKKYLRLIIRLERMDEQQLLQLDRLEGSYRTRDILGVKIPEITLPVAPGRNLAVLLECAARNHVLREGGYNASEEFIEKQQQHIDRKSDVQ